MRKYLEEEMLAHPLNGRIRYGCTSYAGMDGCRVFEICADGGQVKRFSLETVNTYFIENGLTANKTPVGKTEYWAEFWTLLCEIPLDQRTEYTDGEFCEALAEYRNQDIQKSILSENPLVRMFGILDRRIGRRTLVNMKESIEAQPAWLRTIYRLRFEAENIL